MTRIPANLFIEPGDQPPVVHEDLSGTMCELYRATGIFAHEEPVRRVVDRVEQLRPQWVHAMHGGTLCAELLPRFAKAAAPAAVRLLRPALGPMPPVA